MHIINSVFTETELIKSKFFLKYIYDILKKINFNSTEVHKLLNKILVSDILTEINSFNRTKVYKLFKKISEGKKLSKREEVIVTSFLQDERVESEGKKILLSLREIPIKVETVNYYEHITFTNFLSDLLDEDGYKRILQLIGEVAQITNLSLDMHDGFEKVMGLEKSIYLEKSILKVDSTNWEIVDINGTLIRMNPEKNIKEYIEGPLAGEQLFTWESAIKEAKKQRKRLPFADDKNPEFQAIINNIGIEKFINLFPNYCNTDNNTGNRGDYFSFWSASPNNVNSAYSIEFDEGESEVNRFYTDKDEMLYVICILD